MNKLIFGCGYLGLRVARRWREVGDRVHVVTRSASRADELAAEGLLPVVADVTRRATLANLPPADCVLYAVARGRGGNADIRSLYIDGLAAVLSALGSRPERFLYVSSTGVYGEREGETVDEDSPPLPTRLGGQICLEAERLLSAHPWGQRGIILRLAGLYGPGRIPRLDDIRAGRPLDLPTEGYLNLIHVDDATSAVLAAERRGTPPRVYLISDGAPVVRRDYYRQIARLLGAAEPTFATPKASPAAERAAGSKRVSNARMLAELGVSPAYPSYREGLAALLAGPNGP